MRSLFIDTSYDQILGLLSDKKSWIDFKKFEGQKLTGGIHKDIDQLLSQNTIDALNLKSIFYSAGPGFYTGLRVAFGIADIFRLNGILIYSLYSHLIPRMCGIESYLWVTKAYRGEIFVFDSETNEIKLYLENNFTIQSGHRRVFTHSPTAVDDQIKSIFSKLEYSHELLLTHPEKIFEKVKSEESLYYFRPLDEEYKPSI